MTLRAKSEGRQTLSPDHAILILWAYVKDCEVCGGNGVVQRVHRPKRTRENGQTIRLPPRVHYPKCKRCGNAKRLAEQLQGSC